ISILVATRELSYAQGTGDTPLLRQTIGQVLDAAASSYPDQDALVVRHQNLRFSYRQFLEQVDLVARSLLRLGVQKGDRFAIWATNCAEWLFTQFAAAKIGAILVNVNPANRAIELEYVLRQSESRTLLLIQGFRDADYVSIVNGLCPELISGKRSQVSSTSLPHLKNLIFVGEGRPPGMLHWNDLCEMGRGISQADLPQREASLSFEDPINIQYTSGTTGFPKGATLSHHNIVNNGLLVSRSMKFTNHDRLCIPVPFYHCFGMVLGTMACVVSGATMVLPAAFFDPLATLEAVHAEHCTALHGVPTMFIAELDHPEFSRFDLRTLRTVDDPLELRVTTVGRPLPHTEVKIVDVLSGEIVPRGTPGELCTRGYMVMKGYHKNPEATRKAIDPEGWLHSGDLATMDVNDYCKITGRAKDVIIRGGENVYPREIEKFLYTCPGISDVQVIGVPDEKYGEQVVAWVKLEPDARLTQEDIREFCEGKIAAYKIPKHVKIVDSFPMTVTGKIQKFKMREMTTRELGQEAAGRIETA